MSFSILNFLIDGAHRTCPDTDAAFIAVFKKLDPGLVKEHGIQRTCPNTGTAVHAHSPVYIHNITSDKPMIFQNLKVL
jgi:hypothetical protein